MAKLEVLENKKLVLKNVLIKELRNISLDEVDQEIQKFTNNLDILKVKAFGPLVIKSCGTNILDDGTITTDYDLIVQAHDYMQYKNQFVTKQRFECPHCAYIHFDGNPLELNYAHTKLDLFFYENELESTGEIYTVCIQENEDHVVTDLFRPVMYL